MISSLNEVMNNTVENNQEATQEKTFEPTPTAEAVPAIDINKPIAKEGQEVIDTGDGYRIVEKQDISGSEAAKELHSSTPESSLDNLSKLNIEMDEKVAKAQEIADEYKNKQELEEALKEAEKETKFKEVVVEVPEDTVEKLEEKEDPEKAKAKEEAAKKAEEEAKALSEIKVLKFKSDEQKQKRYDRILERRRKDHNKESSQCVLVNSGYAANYSGFLPTEMLAIKNSQEGSDIFSATKYMYEKMYEHQVDSTIGAMTFEQWLKGTSLLELNSIYFALLNSSYPSVNEYPGVCSDPKCNEDHNNKPFTFSYPNSKLMYIEDDAREKVQNQIKDILSSKDPKSDFIHSNVHYVKRKRLDNGTLIDFRHPSLYDHLTNTLNELNKLGLLTEDSDEQKQVFFNILPYIENIFIPDDELGGYFPLNDIKEKLTELTYMSDDDLISCSQEVEEINKCYNIKFGFRGLECPRCHKKLPDQPIANVAEILFLVQMMKGRK